MHVIRRKHVINQVYYWDITFMVVAGDLETNAPTTTQQCGTMALSPLWHPLVVFMTFAVGGGKCILHNIIPLNFVI